MQPVVTPAEMAEIDAAAPEQVDELIHRAGGAVARAALQMMGGAYGRRVVVVAGRGNNGRDGRDAAARLRRRGVDVLVVTPRDAWPSRRRSLPIDLVIDAAYGTGLRDPYETTIPDGLRVLAVDLPSGLDGLTGRRRSVPALAERTVTFAALKPGLLLGDGPDWCGTVEIADIGLNCSRAGIRLVEDRDVAALWRPRPRNAHKWNAAVWVIGGSEYMGGAPSLAAAAAFAAGAGYVRLSTPGGSWATAAPPEAVSAPLAATRWHDEVLGSIERVASVVLGPGLGRSAEQATSVASVVTEAAVPMVVDGDALWAIAPLREHRWPAARVLTPHDGEFALLTGRPPGDDRVGAARDLAVERGAIVLLKGPTTVIAEPGGAVRFVTSGDERLATAGTGDVLAGIIGALLASGMDAFDAASLGAHLHGRAGSRGSLVGMSAGDLVRNVPAAVAECVGAGAGRLRPDRRDDLRPAGRLEP